MLAFLLLLGLFCLTHTSANTPMLSKVPCACSLLIIAAFICFQQAWSTFEGCCPVDAVPVERPGMTPFTLVRLGVSQDYSPGEGLTQEGFVKGHNQLTSVDVRLPASLLKELSEIGDGHGGIRDGRGRDVALSGTEKQTEGSAHKDAGTRKRDGSVTSSRGLLTSSVMQHGPGKQRGGKEKAGAVELRVWVGFEYECPAGHRFLHKPVVKEPVSENSKVDGEKDQINAPPESSQPKTVIKLPVQGAGRPGRAGPRSRILRGAKQSGGAKTLTGLTGGLDAKEWPAIGEQALDNEAEWPSLLSATGKGILPTPPGTRARAPGGILRKGEEAPASTAAPAKPKQEGDVPGASEKRGGASEGVPPGEEKAAWAATKRVVEDPEEFPPLAPSEKNARGSAPSRVGQPGNQPRPATPKDDVAQGSGKDVGVTSADSLALPSVPEGDLPIFRECVSCLPAGPGESETGQRFASGGAQLRRVFIVTPPGPAVFGTAPQVSVGRLSEEAEGRIGAPETDVTAVETVRKGGSSAVAGEGWATEVGGSGIKRTPTNLGAKVEQATRMQASVMANRHETPEGSPIENVPTGLEGGDKSSVCSTSAEQCTPVSLDDADLGGHATTPLPADGFFSLLLPFIYLDEKGEGKWKREPLLSNESGAFFVVASALSLAQQVHQGERSSKAS
jgi:hypothetical protein